MHCSYCYNEAHFITAVSGIGLMIYRDANSGLEGVDYNALGTDNLFSYCIFLGTYSGADSSETICGNSE